jgi:hypothetical protein
MAPSNPVVRTTQERLILDTLQDMARTNDHTIWWRVFRSTPNPDPIDDAQTRSLMHSFPKYEAHLEERHSANCDPPDDPRDDGSDGSNESPQTSPVSGRARTAIPAARANPSRTSGCWRSGCLRLRA